MEQVELCSKCPDLAPCRKISAASKGNRTSKAMIVNQFPDEKSHSKDVYWSNPAGEKLRRICSDIEIVPETNFYFTDVLKCVIPDDRKPTDTQLKNCRGYLEKEIEILQPNYIITIGDLATKQVFSHFGLEYRNILKLHNENGTKEIPVRDIPLVPIQHPSQAPRFMDFVLYRYHLKDVFNLAVGNDVR